MASFVRWAWAMLVRKLTVVASALVIGLVATASPPPARAQGASGSTRAASSYASAEILDVASPLPANLQKEFEVALIRVRAAVDEDAGAGKKRQLTQAQTDRLRCKLHKLADPTTDDREISWSAACGDVVRTDSATQCNTTKDLRVKAEVKSKADIDRKDLRFVYHLRPEIVNVSRRLFRGHGVAAAIGQLSFSDLDRSRSISQLRLMSERTQGFLAAPHYLHLNDWVAKEQRESNSLYVCR